MSASLPRESAEGPVTKMHGANGLVVALTRDVPESGLTAGDLGAIVHVYADGKAFEVELGGLAGETIALVTLPADAVRPVEKGEIAHARKVA